MEYAKAVYSRKITLEKNPLKLRSLARKLRLDAETDNDLAWIVALNTVYANMERGSSHVPVDWGSLKPLDLDRKYSRIAKRFQEWADAAGIGGKEIRHFQAEPLIKFAIENNVTHLDIDDIYSKQMDNTQERGAEAIGMPKSRSGKQCLDECVANPKNECQCPTTNYSTWYGTYNWDYCHPERCVRKNRTTDV